MLVGQQDLPRQAHCFGNGLFADVATPIIDDRFPGHARGDLFQNVGDEDAAADKRGLAMANRWVSDNVPSECLCHATTSSAVSVLILAHPHERLDEYLIANGLTTREALDRAAAASGRRRA
jgi:hypothetical protein